MHARKPSARCGSPHRTASTPHGGTQRRASSSYRKTPGVRVRTEARSYIFSRSTWCPSTVTSRLLRSRALFCQNSRPMSCAEHQPSSVRRLLCYVLHQHREGQRTNCHTIGPHGRKCYKLLQTLILHAASAACAPVCPDSVTSRRWAQDCDATPAQTLHPSVWRGTVAVLVLCCMHHG